MEFESTEVAMYNVVKKYRPIIDALSAELESDDGLVFIPAVPMTEEQKQRLLFGHFFTGLDKPLRFDHVL